MYVGRLIGAGEVLEGLGAATAVVLVVGEAANPLPLRPREDGSWARLAVLVGVAAIVPVLEVPVREVFDLASFALVEGVGEMAERRVLILDALITVLTSISSRSSGSSPWRKTRR